MRQYDLKQLLGIYKDSSFNQELVNRDYKYLIEAHTKINVPDFITIILPRGEDPVLFTKNFSLDFPEGSDQSLYSLIDYADAAQAGVIAKADKMCVDFAVKNEDALQNTIFQLHFKVNFPNSKPRTLLRNISFIKKKYRDSYYTLFFVTISDVTEFYGLRPFASANIRCTEINDNILKYKLKALKTELNKILTGNIKLTKREEQILDLIASGKTSKEISQQLKITVNTVNTHRQNLINKFKVSNTTALLKII